MYLIPLPYRHKDITLVFQVSRELLSSMAQIKQQMIIGPDKNVYVEPVIWTAEYVQRTKYRYPQTTSN